MPALSVRRVAEAAGCTTMLVYSRLGGKSGLLQALYNEGFDLLAAQQQALPLSLAPRQRVHALCAAFVRLASHHPHHYALMLGAHSAEFDPAPDSRLRALATLDHLADAVRRALGGSRNKPQRADLAARQLFALCHGWCTLLGTGLVQASQAESLARAVDALLDAA